MRWLSTCIVALALATAAAPAAARPPNRRDSPPVEPSTENEKVEAAIKAWSGGDWTRVRALLEPLLQGDRNLAEPLLHETALRYLADATIQDQTLDENIRRELAAAYVERLLASSPDWRPPVETHSREFYLLYDSLREQRDRAKAQQCTAERASCQADLQESQTRHTRLLTEHAALKKAFGEQEVEVREKVARNRAVALIPFGVGQFYNGRKGLGAAFLASEVVFGGVGLGLLIARTFNCSRQNGYQPGSLSCIGTGAGAPVVRQRNAEQAMGLFFLGTVALDILIAQITFRPYLTVKSTRVRRSDLEAGADENRENREQKGPRGDTPARRGDTPARRSRIDTRDILRVAPAPAFIPGGGGLGVSLRF